MDFARSERKLSFLKIMRLSICLVSDFFWPNIGGVENHIYQLAVCLQRRGHKVVVVTRAYGEEYSGMRLLPGVDKEKGAAGDVKVYYIPRLVLGKQVTLPTILPFYSTFHDILRKEEVDIVHGHQSSSPLVHECICIGRALGCKTILTEHSLYGMSERFLSFESVINKFLEITLCHVDHVICVSEKCRENLISRTSLVAPPEVSAIPNAINSWEFEPDHSKRSPGYPSVNIVLLSRLVHRKGIDLAEQVIPAVCEKYPQVHFIIGGGGPRKAQLRSMITQHGLESRVEMLGFVPPGRVRDVLVRGHIFLNCSFTESFCISLMEAASCGLQVVSTNVGGVPEVLPPDLITLAEPCTSSLLIAIGGAIESTLAEERAFTASIGSGADGNPDENQAITPVMVRESRQHERVKALNCWMDIALRTEAVYASVFSRSLYESETYSEIVGAPHRHVTKRNKEAAHQSLASRMECYSRLGWLEYLFAVSLLLALEVTALVVGRPTPSPAAKTAKSFPESEVDT